MDITDGIVCVTKLTELPWRLDYTIENTTAHAYEVDLDFAGSSNLVVVREDSLVFRGSLRPYARVTTAIVRVHPAERCAVCVNYYVRRIEEAAVDSLDDSALDQAGTATDDACIDAFFHDPTFPPTPTCLGELGGAPATKRLVPTLTWTHLSSLYPSSWTIFPRSPTIPTSTLCGGDPTLVSADTRSALQFIGSRPSFLTALFSQTNGVNGHDHRYVVCLHHDGKPVRVTVDGYVPCFGQTGGPVLMKCISGHLWPLLLHKALAKLYGGYVPMFQVSALQLLEDIFGYPSVDVCAVGARATTIAAVANLLRQGHLVGVTVSASSGSRHGLLVNANPSTGLTIRSYPADQALRSDIITTVALQDIPSALRAWWCFPQLSRPQQVVRRCFVVDATACTSASAAMFAWSIPSPCTVMVSATYDQHVHDAGISILHVSPSNHLTPVKATSTKQGIRARSCSIVLSVEPGEYVMALKPVRWSTLESPTRNRMDRMFDMLDADVDDRLSLQDLERFMTVYEDGLPLSTRSFAWLMEQFDSDGIGLTRKGLGDLYTANQLDTWLDREKAVWDEPSIPCMVNFQCTCMEDVVFVQVDHR